MKNQGQMAVPARAPLRRIMDRREFAPRTQAARLADPFAASASMSDTVIQPRPPGHPLAGERMSGARMIMQVLADEGVTAIFGYSGGAILPTYDAVFLYNEQHSQAGEPGAGHPAIPLIV